MFQLFKIETSSVMVIFIQVVQGIITLIPYMIGIAYFFTSEKANFNILEQESFASIGIFGSLIIILSLLLNYFFNTIASINQGIIYYSLCNEREKTSIISKIDSIRINND